MTGVPGPSPRPKIEKIRPGASAAGKKKLAPLLMVTINNGASFFFPAALAPGLIFSIFGRGLGPGTPVIPAFSGGYLPILMGGARVLVNGVPCPLLYVSESQINAVASFAVD